MVHHCFNELNARQALFIVLHLWGHERKAWTEYFDLIIYIVNRFSLNHVLEHTLSIQIAYTI